MGNFYRFPHTPHLAWLGDGPVRDDKILTQSEADEFLKNVVVVEEKVDGANLGFSLSENGNLQIQQRGDYLQEPYGGQFGRLNGWLSVYGKDIKDFLDCSENKNLVLFGEWCAAKHSTHYDKLPDFFLLFDIVDKYINKFWSVKRRDEVVDLLGLQKVPKLFKFRGNSLSKTLQIFDNINKNFSSQFYNGNPEGFIFRYDDILWNLSRAKLVRKDFTQTIEEHWKNKPLVFNQIIYS